MSDWTTIPIVKETRERLKVLGVKGETYDDIIARLIIDKENRDAKEKGEEQKNKLKK